MTVTVSPPPVVLQGAAPVAPGAMLVLLGAPVRILAPPAGPLTRPGFYVVETAGLTIALAPSASPVWIRDRTGTATIAASVDGAASPFAFRAAGDGVTLVYSPDESTWLQF